MTFTHPEPQSELAHPRFAPTEYSEYGLPFVRDADLFSAVQYLVNKMHETRAKHNIERNVLDPFSALFASSLSQISIDQWRDQEMIRQIDKTLSNHIGIFHQKLIGCLPGWRDTGTQGGGIDLIYPNPWGERKNPIVAEVKNKYNTMNSSSAKETFNKLEQEMKFHSRDTHTSYDGYLIVIIAKNATDAHDKPWTVSGTSNPRIRKIGGANFYATTTGDKDALWKIYHAIPAVIADIGYPLTDNLDELGKIFHKAFPD